MAAVDRLLTEDFRDNGEARGREGQKRAVEGFLRGFSDLHNEVTLILAEARNVVEVSLASRLAG